MSSLIPSPGYEFTTSDNDPIRKFQSNLEDLGTRAEGLRPILKACQDAIQRAESDATCSIKQVSRYDVAVDIMVVCQKLDEVIPLLRELAKEGLHTDKDDTHTDTSLFEVFAIREYNLGRQCKLTAFLNTEKSGPGCRMVQTGVKEVPEYEIVCDE